MTEELQLLRDIVSRLDASEIAYMLTGSVALNCYAQPRMTRDIDLVVAFHFQDAERIHEILGPDYYVSENAAREAVTHQSSFYAIHHGPEGLAAIARTVLEGRRALVSALAELGLAAKSDRDSTPLPCARPRLKPCSSGCSRQGSTCAVA